MQTDKQDLEQYAQDLGKKLGFLIANLKTSTDVKESFLEIISDFSLEQLERITQILENGFLDKETDYIEKKLITELERIREETIQKEEELNEKFIKRVNL